MNWLRLHSEARTDAKLRSLSDQQHRIWFNLLCFASEQEQRGTIAEYDSELLAIEVASGDVDALDDALSRLKKLRIISQGKEGVITFIHWHERQYDKPSDRPERVAARVSAHRERQRNADVTPSNALYTDTDTDTDPKTDTEREPDRADSPSSTKGKVDEAIGASAPSRAQAAPPSKKEKASPQPEAPKPETPENVTPLPTAPTARARDPIWDTFVELAGPSPETKSERNKWGKCVKEIKEVNGTPDEMRLRAARYIAKYGRDRLTVTALVSHWGEFAIEQPSQQRNGENYHNGHDSSHAGLAQRSGRPQGENRGDARQKQGEPTAEQRALQRKYAEQYGYAHRLDKTNAAS